MSRTSRHSVLTGAVLGIALTLTAHIAEARAIKAPAAVATPASASSGWLSALTHDLVRWAGGGFQSLWTGPAVKGPASRSDVDPGDKCATVRDPSGVCVIEVD
jgi:hypothetical protein